MLYKNLIKLNICAQKDNDCHGFFSSRCYCCLPSVIQQKCILLKICNRKHSFPPPSLMIWKQWILTFSQLQYRQDIFWVLVWVYAHVVREMLCRSSCLGWWAGVKKEKITKIFRDRKSFQFLINENEQLPLNKHFQLLSNRFKTSLYKYFMWW